MLRGASAPFIFLAEGEIVMKDEPKIPLGTTIKMYIAAIGIVVFGSLIINVIANL